jgi:phosphoribosyl-ATP pyrophosphohydrolase
MVYHNITRETQMNVEDEFDEDEIKTLADTVNSECYRMTQPAFVAMMEKLEYNRGSKPDFDSVTIKEAVEGIQEEYNEVGQQYYEYYMNPTETEKTKLIYEAADLMNYCALLIYVLGKETDGIYSL